MAKLIDTKGLEVFKGLIEDQIPENLSELSNDAGFITADDIPTKLSEFENDPGFLTNADISEYADKNYVDQKVSDLVSNAPETLDTLKELADALGNDKDFSTTVLTELGKKANDTEVLHKAKAETITGLKTVQNGTAFRFDLGKDSVNGNSRDFYVDTKTENKVFSVCVNDVNGYSFKSENTTEDIIGAKLILDSSHHSAYQGLNTDPATSKFELHTGTVHYAYNLNGKRVLSDHTRLTSAILKGEIRQAGAIGASATAKLTWDGREVLDSGNYTSWVKNPAITIKKNDAELGSFTLNQDTAQTINIPVPTKLSEFENDLNLLTSDEVAGIIAASIIPITNAEIDNICVKA